MKTVHECVKEVRQTNITVKEHGRRINFINQTGDRFHLARVDGCLVRDGARADYIVTKIGVGSVIIELKGKDIRHAFDQILATLNHKNCVNWIKRRHAMLIACSRVPRFDSTIAKAKVEAKKRGSQLKVVCGGGDFHVEDILPVA